MKKILAFLGMVVGLAAVGHAGDAPAPATATLLKPGDTVLIIGDGISEQRMYSALIEDYLLMCQPKEKLRASQAGGAERISDALGRLQATMLPFAPTVVTDSYGMDDGGYGPMNDHVGKAYRDAQSAMVDKFKAAGVRVIVLGVGAVDADAAIARFGTREKAMEYNKTLAALSDLDKSIAESKGVTFVDLHGLMLDVMGKAKASLGPTYVVCDDGVHPNWSGHLIMACAFLKALRCDGNIGTITFDAAAGAAQATDGHKVLAATKTRVTLESARYPFCFTSSDPKPSNNTSSILPYLPFNQELNRFILVVKNPPANKVKITWGTKNKVYDAAEAAKGINLAADFLQNPFSEIFNKVQGAVLRQQYAEFFIYREYLPSLAHMQADFPDQKELFDKLQAALQDKIKALREATAGMVGPVTHTVKVEAAE